MTQEADVHSARTWTIAIILMVVGMLAFTWILLAGIVSVRQGYQRFTAPATVTLNLTEPGAYTLYHEFSRTPDSLGFDKPPGAQHLRFALMRASDNERIDLVRPPEERFYSRQKMVGEGLYEFTAPEAGQYQLTATYAREYEGEPVQLALRQTYGAQVVDAMLQGLGLLLLVGLMVTALFVWRRRRRQAAMQHAARTEAA